MQEVVSVSLMRESDRKTIEKLISSRELMLCAGKALFEVYNWHGKIAIVCGGGNNGGDGLVLALLLQENQFDVTVYCLDEPSTEDCKYYFGLCKTSNIQFNQFCNGFLKEYDVIVDCIFGTGFRGNLNGIARDAVTEINESDAFVISADINSGLNGDNGFSELAVRSDLTVSIGYFKTGHFLNMAKDVMKKKINANIGIELSGEPYYLAEQKDFKDILIKRNNFSNKGTYGRTAIIGGCTNYSGAVKLSNLSCSALRSGSGLVSVLVGESLAQSVMPYLLESILYTIPDSKGKMLFVPEAFDVALKKVNSVVLGIGWGDSLEYKLILEYLLENYKLNLLIDADGISVLGRVKDEILAKSKCKIVITPHPAEFARLTGDSVESVLDNPIEKAKKFAENTGIIVLLKGTTTIVTDGKTVHLVDRGCPGMATAGSGDVLSGIIGGLNAFNDENLLQNAVCGAYIAGVAGELAEKERNSISMLASDTVNKISEAISMMM